MNHRKQNETETSAISNTLNSVDKKRMWIRKYLLTKTKIN